MMRENRLSGLPTRSDTNQPSQSQKIDKSKFKKNLEELYCSCSQTKALISCIHSFDYCQVKNTMYGGVHAMKLSKHVHSRNTKSTFNVSWRCPRLLPWESPES